MANPENNISNDGMMLYVDILNVFKNAEFIRIIDNYTNLEELFRSPPKLFIGGQIIASDGRTIVVSIESTLDNGFFDSHISVGAEDYMLSREGVEDHSQRGEFMRDSSIKTLGYLLLTRVEWNEEQTERLWRESTEELIIPGNFTLEDEK